MRRLNELSALAAIALGLSACDAILGAHFGDAHLDANPASTTAGTGGGIGGGGAPATFTGGAGGAGCPITQGSSDDPENCGTPCHSCLGGSCVAGICQPVAIVAGLSYPYALDVDATNIYWTSSTDGTVNTAPIDGGAPRVLVTEQSPNVPTFIAVNDQRIYWTVSAAGTIRGLDKDGASTPVDVITGEQNPVYLGATTTRLFWFSNGQLRAGSTDGSSRATIGSIASGTPPNLRVYGSGVFWVDFYGGGIFRADTTAQDQSTMVTLYTDPAKNIRDVAVDGTTIFWPHEIPRDIVRGDLSGAAVTNVNVIGQLPENAMELVAEGGGLYTAGNLGSIYEVDETTGKSAPLWVGAGRKLHVTSCCVFWLAFNTADPSNSAVMKLAR